MKTKKFKDFKPQNNLLNELYTKFLNINYENIENYYNKRNGQNGTKSVIGYNVDELLNLGINDIRNIYQQYSHSDEFESLNNINLYNIYLNDVHYLVNYILHHHNQFENDKKDLVHEN